MMPCDDDRKKLRSTTMTDMNYIFSYDDNEKKKLIGATMIEISNFN